MTVEQGQNMARVEDAARERVRRRSVLQGVGAGALGAAVLGGTALAAAGMASTPAEAQAINDANIFTFALNLEYLEAEFYLRAVTGQGLPASMTGGSSTQGTVTGGSKVPFTSSAIASYAQNIAGDEVLHVNLLRSALGANVIAEPSINLSTSFTALAVAAGLIQQGQTFNPFANDVSFLLGAFIFEDVGVTAYAGAARYVSDKANLTYAASILATEAYHGGAIRSLLADLGAGQAANQISALRASLGGGADQGIFLPQENYNFASTDSNALAFRRTPSQVLNIVYGGGAPSNYLFFPNRMNGPIS